MPPINPDTPAMPSGKVHPSKPTEDALNQGLSKKEYAAIQIAAELAKYNPDPEYVAKTSAKIANRVLIETNNQQ